MKLVTRLLICSIPFMLVGCSHLSKSTFSQNRDKSYLYAKSIPPLSVPPGLKNDSFHALYPVSYQNYPVRYEDVSVTPPGLYG